MKIQVEQLARSTGSSLPKAMTRIETYNEVMDLYEISTSRQRMCMFLANVGYESGGFKFSVEIWGPTSSQRRYTRDLSEPWPSSADDLNDPTFEANRLAYTLGNDGPEDGSRYRGRGDLETTGKSNYASLTKRLQARFPTMNVPDFVIYPDSLINVRWACFSACDYISMKGCNEVADDGNFDHYCDLINKGHITPQVGDSNGFNGRVKLYTAAKAAFGVDA